MIPMTRPRFWVVTVATLMGVAVTLSLGRWQLDRAAQKQALQDAVANSATLAPMDAVSLVEQKADAGPSQLHRPVRIDGFWQPRWTVYLDNRQMDGRPGFFVYTPLRLKDTGRDVLVQRGWVARDFQDRTRIAPISTPEGLVHVEGRLAAAPGRLYQLGEAGTGPIRQNLELDAFRRETGLPLVDALVVQTGAASEGLLRNWPAFDAGVDKHHGYAFQWFGLAALISTLYVWFQFIQPRREQRRRSQG